MLLVITLNYSISKFRSPLSLQLNEISCECCSDVTSNKEERPQRCSQVVLLLRTRSMCFRLDEHVARLCYDTLLNLSALLPREQQSHILTSSTSCTCEEEPKGLWTTVERVYRPHETWNPPLLCQTHADPPGAGSASLS